MQDDDKERTDHSFTSFHRQAAFAFLITPEVLGKLTGGEVGVKDQLTAPVSVGLSSSLQSVFSKRDGIAWEAAHSSWPDIYVCMVNE